MASTSICDSVAGLSRFREHALDLFLQCVEPSGLLHLVRDVVFNDRWNSFDGFRRTAQGLASRYRECGARAQVYTAPTGGKRGMGDWIIPEAEDFRSATLEVIEPLNRSLIDFGRCPWHVVQWSTATPDEGITCDLVAVDSLEELAHEPHRLRGKMVLTRLQAQEVRGAMSAAGAAGVVFDSPVAKRADAVAWTKFGWGGIGLSDPASPLVGFVISSLGGDELRSLLRKGRVRIHARLEVRRYAGSHEVVSGLITGREDPDTEIWAVAHAFEPGALDNASGVATCVEIARVTQALVNSGRLPPPRRTIRLLSGYECYGFFHYFQTTSRLQPPLAGVCIDTVGARPNLCGEELRWHDTVPGSASFVEEIGADLLEAALARNPVYRLRRMPFLSTEDTLLGDPKFGFPCPWITNHPAVGYHSSADTIDTISSEGLALCTAAMAAYLYCLAEMGTDESLQIARHETRQTLQRLQTGATNAAGVETLVTSHEASIRRLQRFVWTGDHGQLTREFDEMRLGVERVGRPRSLRATQQRDEPERLIPLRHRSLAPTPENVWPDVRRKLGGSSFPKWIVYFADGERNLDAIRELIAFHTGESFTREVVNGHFEALAELGYVELLRPEDFATEERIARDLLDLGVRPGMDVVAHSSMGAIGPVWGGAETVVRAILSVLGPEGTLLAPSFNHFHAHVFNPLTTPTTNGAIPEAIWRQAEAKRSLHPTHSVAAIGRRAEEYLTAHLQHGVWAAESPLGRLIDAGGYVLSIGVGHDRSTAYHLGEIALNVPCLDSFGSLDQIVDAKGCVREVKGLAWRAEVCPVDPGGLDDLLKHVQRRGKVGRAPSTLVRAAEISQARIRQLDGRCLTCPIRPNPRDMTQVDQPFGV